MIYEFPLSNLINFCLYNHTRDIYAFTHDGGGMQRLVLHYDVRRPYLLRYRGFPKRPWIAQNNKKFERQFKVIIWGNLTTKKCQNMRGIG